MAIPVETFILFTTITLQEEEMVSHALTAPSISVTGVLTPKHGAPLDITASLGLLAKTRNADPGLQAIWNHSYSGEMPHQHQPPEAHDDTVGEGVNEYHSRIIAATGTAGVILVYISISISSNLSFVQRAVRVLYSIQYQGLDKD